MFGRNRGFDVRLCLCVHVFHFLFNIYVALCLWKKHVDWSKWTGKQRFAKDL